MPTCFCGNHPKTVVLMFLSVAATAALYGRRAQTTAGSGKSSESFRMSHAAGPVIGK
jgi:hypothetical protein